jgi:MFS family permease
MGFHITVSAIGIMLIGIFWGKYGKYISPKMSIIISSLILAFSAAGLSFESSYLTIIFSFLLGASGSVLNISSQSILSDYHGDAKKIAIGEAAIVSSLFGAIAPIVLSYLNEETSVGWKGGLFLPILIFMVILPLVIKLNFNVSPKISQLKDLKTSARKDRTFIFWGYLLLLILCGATEWGVLYWASSFMVEVGHIELSKAVKSISLLILFQILGRILWTRLSDKYTINKLLISCIIISALGISSFYSQVIRNESFALLTICLFVFSIGISGTNQFTTVKIIESNSKNSINSMSLISFTSGLSVVIFPFLIGSQANSFGLQISFIIPLLCIFCAVALNMLLIKKEITCD